MPETPPEDDQFADLFSKLPAPRAAAPGAAEAPPNPTPADTSADAPVPGSRRAARAAAAATGDVPVAAPADTSAAAGAPAAAPVGAAPAAHQLDTLFGGGHDDTAERARDARHARDRRKSRIAAWVVFGVILAVVGGLVGGGFYVWNTYEDKIRAFMGWEEPNDYEEGLATGEVYVTIVEGDTGSSISQTLYEMGVTKTREAFYDYLIAEALNPTFYPGVFQLQEKMSAAAALAALEDENNRVENSITIPEGYTYKQALSAVATATGLSEDELLAAADDYTQFGVPAEAPSIEGYLFPATYTFDPGATATEVIQRMVDETFSRLDALGVAEEDRFRVLTLAGLVQKESGPDYEDMRKIARVFLNRIADGMLLQSDATVAYGAGITGTVWTTEEERADESNLYNTYVHEGLPIGPISLPGEDAIKAAIDPAEGDWLYFVAVDLRTGETVFSHTYEEHLAAVEQLDAWCRESGNESYCE
ncbi:endolytic transglycosylase MltG [Microbacterium sp.]|uniref:endolytic transglycosylase MltG n=1 Tax=Microbacterium sp. TaxID=51671 RepID=UPI0039E2AB0D